MIDEIQRKPELFSLLRYLVDQQINQKYLILGIASSSLKQQSSESLAGRIGYYYLSGFNLSEVGAAHYRKLWLRGGFPRSYLTEGLEESRLWRENSLLLFWGRTWPPWGALYLLLPCTVSG
jgi:hypothetical protein